MKNSIKKLTSEELNNLTSEIHALANEVAMHGWDYRPLLKANQLLEAFCVATEIKYWIAQLSTNWGYDDQGRRVEWNTFNMHPVPVPSDYKPGTNEVKIEAATLGSAFDKAASLYCKNDCDIRITATGYIFEETNL
jgi:hypothetical protein